MSQLCITRGRVVDPSQQLDRVTNILIENGRIAALDVEVADAPTLSAAGRVVAPGLVDMYCELREPGLEEDETILTGARAALAGGYTCVACAPGTEPPLDSQASVQYVLHKAAEANLCRVAPLACLSKGREGRELAELASLRAAGAVGFTDGERPLQNSELLRRALEYCRMLDRPILVHPEVAELTGAGVMHEGLVSLALGLPGMPAVAEDIRAARDIRLAEVTGGRLHLMNVSTAATVDLLRSAKPRLGARLTAECAPPNFCFTDDEMRGFDTHWKVNPPLRPREDVEACVAGLRDGVIEVIASHHAPRSAEKKMVELDQAPFGMAMLETTLALVVTRLIAPGHLTWSQAIAALSCNPARALGLREQGSLRVGALADLTLIDPDRRWRVSPADFFSKSANSPLGGVELQGKVTCTIVGGVAHWFE